MKVEQSSNRPPLRISGGKFRDGPWTVGLMPEHRYYFEGFGGGFNILCFKPRAKGGETVIDINRWFVNFFAVLRDHTEDLLARIELTPWAREPYEKFKDLRFNPPDDPIEMARILYMECAQSIHAKPFSATGWRHSAPGKSWRKKRGTMYWHNFLRQYTGKWASLTEMDVSHLVCVAERLKGVQIESRSVFDEMLNYDTPETLIYLDPPYLKEGTQRTSDNVYEFDFDTQDHIRLLNLCHEVQDSMIMIAGYRSSLYEWMLESGGWHRVDKKTVANAGAQRTESIWFNKRAWNRPIQGVLL